MMITYIPSTEAIERFKQECKKEESNLLSGKCQLCVDALLLLTPIHRLTTVKSTSFKSTNDESETPSVLSGDAYLIDLIRKCPSVKVIYPTSIPFNGFVDLSLFEACIDLELIRIPFSDITGIEQLRQNLRSLTWVRGYIHDEQNDSDTNIFQSFSSNSNSNSKTLRIDESFWKQFGSWPKLTHLCIFQSYIYHIDISSMPSTIQSIDLKLNRINHLNNLSDYSITSTLTKLCLDYNSLKELPKLNSHSCATLVHLSLRGNLIKCPTDLRKLRSLEFLDLSDNSICDQDLFLQELEFLSTTLKIFYISGNPICFRNSFTKACLPVLFKLVLFNGNPIKPKSDMRGPVLPTSNVDTQPLLAALDNSSYLNENINDDSLARSTKSKASRERFVVINEASEAGENTVQTSMLNDSCNMASASNIQVKNFKKKNYFFGGVSGSYGSFNPTAPIDASEVVMGCDIETLNETVSQKGGEFNEGDLLTSDLNKKNTNDETSLVIEIQNQNNALDLSNVCLDDSSEWVSEDTSDENTVFLVEILSIDNLSDSDTNYLFIRVKPHDGLIFEKDCTSGKILQTLDLKVLVRYECLNESVYLQPFVLKLIFDTCIVTKQERIYRFLDEDSFSSFIRLYLSDTNRFKRQAESNQVVSTVRNASDLITMSSTPNSNFPWLYMCLRCGNRTHRIITDCSKCGSDLIIKDEGVSKSIEKTSDITKDISLIDNSYDDENLNKTTVSTESNFYEADTTLMNEENIDNESIFIDGDYFKRNIDHYLKLHIEIYICEKIGDDSLKSESVEAVCPCKSYCFEKGSFKSALIVFTSNYFFLFDYLDDNSYLDDSEENIQSRLKSNNDKGMLDLQFYQPLFGINSQIILSHLPLYLKNIGFWIECSIKSKRKDRRKKLKKDMICFIMLVLFGDEEMGKAFLELFFQCQKRCLRSQNKDAIINDTDLVLVKTSITKSPNDELEEQSFKNDVVLQLDESIASLLKCSKNEFNNNNIPYDISNDIGTALFMVQSFMFVQNANNKNNLFTINENNVLIIIKEHLILGELFCHFSSILFSMKVRKSSSIAKVLQSFKQFNDSIEVKKLFQETIFNLLPNIFINKNDFWLILRFREEDEFSLSNKLSVQDSDGNNQSCSTKSNSTVCEFRIQFFSLNTLLRVSRLIRAVWEDNFGISLSISKCLDQ